MKKLISYIEKNNLKKFIDHLATLLKEASIGVNQVFRKKDLKYSTFRSHTLFSYACLHGRLEICKHLVSKKADPIGDKSGIGKGFPLAISVLHSQFHVADWLQEEFNIDCSINNSWPLTISAEYGNLNGVKYALNHNADIHASVDYALRAAAEHGHFDIVKYLVSKGANIHVFDSQALRWAALNGHLDIVKYLISKGADIHASNDYTLRYAAKNGHLSIVKYLISEGADIHANQDQALRYAVQNNHFKTAEYLLDHGANPNAKDGNDYVLQQLMDRGQFKLAAKAVSYGADITVLPPEQQDQLRAYVRSNKKELNSLARTFSSSVLLEKAEELRKALDTFLDFSKEAACQKDVLNAIFKEAEELQKKVDFHVDQILDKLRAKETLKKTTADTGETCL